MNGHAKTLLGKTKSEAEEAFGKENVALWASSYDIAPHPMSTDGLYYPKDDRRCDFSVCVPLLGHAFALHCSSRRGKLSTHISM